MKRDEVDDILDAWRVELPDLPSEPLEIVKRIARLSGVLDAATADELQLLGLTRAEYDVLATLRRSGPPFRMRPGTLTSSLLLSSGGTSNVIRRLAEAGYVARRAAEQDGRGALVELTDEGVRIAEKAVRAATGAQAAVLDRIPAEVSAVLVQTLRTSLDAIRGEAPRRALR
ncbi:MarR family winged helix-turn-helix transcriptional regulator [Actinoplanes palleronii]|uniref:MarR family transcriptional regulator n=1 Tax=Actinoplanes palleronii TaxID=113570 RepID=A0ABQ4BCC3_9ACTN|nr:MarR family transcriptional regulator [Actinoplanes palleronii]GIE68330.1 MarR family transcriptional regulator [Actinoplanes palleronii]